MNAIVHLIVLVVSLGSSSLPDCAGKPVYFEDPKLKAAVEAKLVISNPDCVQMCLLTYIDASNKGIKSLVGLEYALNLKELYLTNNLVSDLTPLTELPLERLGLYHNQVKDLTPLSCNRPKDCGRIFLGWRTTCR